MRLSKTPFKIPSIASDTRKQSQMKCVVSTVSDDLTPSFRLLFVTLIHFNFLLVVFLLFAVLRLLLFFSFWLPFLRLFKSILTFFFAFFFYLLFAFFQFCLLIRLLLLQFHCLFFVEFFFALFDVLKNSLCTQSAFFLIQTFPRLALEISIERIVLQVQILEHTEASIFEKLRNEERRTSNLVSSQNDSGKLVIWLSNKSSCLSDFNWPKLSGRVVRRFFDRSSVWMTSSLMKSS